MAGQVALPDSILAARVLDALRTEPGPMTKHSILFATGYTVPETRIKALLDGLVAAGTITRGTYDYHGRYRAVGYTLATGAPQHDPR
jgi:hypothetical protein